jgi:hypothetical protein
MDKPVVSSLSFSPLALPQAMAFLLFIDSQHLSREAASMMRATAICFRWAPASVGWFLPQPSAPHRPTSTFAGAPVPVSL